MLQQKAERDYTGVASKELAVIINRYFGEKEQLVGSLKMFKQGEDENEVEAPSLDEMDYGSVTDFSEAVQAKETKVSKKSDMQTWCECNDLPVRSIRRIRNQEYQFTGLNLADKICCALDSPALLHTMTIIPAENASSAIKMAEDEFVALALREDPAMLAERAEELRELRSQVLGERTEYQKQMLSNDVARSQRRAAVAN